ncbi:unnamed protein product [Danaus chrysippus]|uniref:(African queen) hypothetical protein n=1 Tax=Danaus chrysippus TaxID=151541 RepID=A0A8J2QRL7_9NEOP|nr:unnamed protein product [Danaus chrysippus]
MSVTSAVANAAAAAAAAGAGKKAAQVQLQAELNNDDEWNKFLLRDGLLVIDVYTEWCGPCIGMVGNLKKIKVEIGGDNLHLAVAKADTIGCLSRFRNRSEPTWMFISGGQLINVVFGADAPRLARTIVEELKNEELVKKGERQRPTRAPHELTPPEQEVALAQEKLLQQRKEKEAAAAAAERLERREARAVALEVHFNDVCPALMMPHSQKNIRKVSDALEPYGVIVADKCPLVLGKDGAKALGVEDPEFAKPETAMALLERPALVLLLKKLPDKEGSVIELVRRAIYNEGIESDENEAKKSLAEELRANDIPGVFVPTDRHQRAAALDLFFPKMVSAVAAPLSSPEPPHVAVILGAWQRRAVLNILNNKLPSRLLRYGFFKDADVERPTLLCKTIDQYEERPDKDFSETIVLMVSVCVSEAGADGVPHELLALGPLWVSEDAVLGKEECARFFPPGYSQPETKPGPKPKKKKKKRHDTKEETADNVDAPIETHADTEAGEGSVEGDAEPEGEGEEEGEERDEEQGDGDGEEGQEEELLLDKGTSPPPVND